jgi:hypothetical protein
MSNITNTTNFIHNIIESCKVYLIILYKRLFYNTIISVILFICSLIVLYFTEQTEKFKFQVFQPLPIILFISFLSTIAIIILAPSKGMTYLIYPAILLLALVIPYIVAKFNQSKIVLVALFLCLIVYSSRVFSNNQIYFLCKGEIRKVIFCQKPEIPVITRTDNVSKLQGIVCYFQDAQFYEFAYSNEMLMKKINDYKEVFVLIEKNESNDFVCPENYSIVEQDTSYMWFFKVYHLQRNY